MHCEKEVEIDTIKSANSAVVENPRRSVTVPLTRGVGRLYRNYLTSWDNIFLCITLPLIVTPLHSIAMRMMPSASDSDILVREEGVILVHTLS